jgi:hypothetical protein
VVALFEQAKEGGYDGGHARGRSEAGFCAFECAEAVGEFLDGGVAETAIHEGFLFVGEYGAHVFGVVIAEAAGQEERGGMFLVGSLVGADTDGFGDSVR